MATLGRLLKQGWGAPVSLEAANAWYAKAAAAFEKAAKAEDEFAAVAMTELAKQLLAGDGVARDPDRAIALYEESAARGNLWAIIDLRFGVRRRQRGRERSRASAPDVRARRCRRC